MSKKLLELTVYGARKRWSFTFSGDPAFLDDWRADGLDVTEVENIIPAWIARAGLTRPWCFIQDLLNFKSPWN